MQTERWVCKRKGGLAKGKLRFTASLDRVVSFLPRFRFFFLVCLFVCVHRTVQTRPAKRAETYRDGTCKSQLSVEFECVVVCAHKFREQCPSRYNARSQMQYVEAHRKMLSKYRDVEKKTGGWEDVCWV